MDMVRSKKILIWVAICFWVMAGLIYAVAYPQFRYETVASDTLSPTIVIGEFVDGMEIQQRLTVPAERVEEVRLMAGTYERENAGTMLLAFKDLNGEVLAQASYPINDFENVKDTVIKLPEPLTGRRGQAVMLCLTTEGCAPGASLTLYSGNAIAGGRIDVPQMINEEDRYTLNGEAGQGALCVSLRGFNEIGFYRYYWLIVGGVFLVALALCVFWWKQAQRGKNNPLVMVCALMTKYDFLFRQLVNRDFKAKYKRSMLGMLWSFLNPLLTMAVQYIVFSTLFKSNIENYPVYLLVGIVFFNFFSEAVSMGMTSITSNASLIKKVYVPKYIYPISRVASSMINFLLALIPLVLVMIVTRTGLHPSLFLVVFDVLCFLGFIAGMSLLLTTSMTFFQDTQFLWNVVSMIWMYLTPIFYPESIIPQNMLGLYRMNPLYQYITFARTCIISGISPAPMMYLKCIVSACVVMLVGAVVFKKHQDRFVLYL